ncbi:MAG: hypothetical protein U1F57_04115 [bacterium]
MTRDQIPEPLRPWIDWVLHDQKDRDCPFFSGRQDRECAWPSAVRLQLQEKGGGFSQSWWVNREILVPLPGDDQNWPQDVKLDGQAAPVIEKDSAPMLSLKPGPHQVTGSFAWDSLPESLKIPPETGIVELSLSGKTIVSPKRDQEGQLWLEKSSNGSKEENRFEIRVHRLLSDEIPALLTTRLELNVSGKNQEVTFNKVAPEGFIPMSIDSPLPAKIEKDGALKLQVRPGNWNVEIQYRHEGPVTAITLPSAQENWAPEEIWAFEAQNNLRVVSVEGPPSIDPTQTTQPAEWKKFPTYRLKPGETITLVEKRRGDSDPAPDQLSLSRDLWLDFNGGGLTVQDQINGSIQRGTRLEMNPPFVLGRVTVNGQDRLITTLKGDPLSGVEVGQGNIQVSADSRTKTKASTFSAVGWNHDFQQVSARLNLPPGWRIFSARGVDQAAETWIHRWNLMDLFLVLVIAFAFGKLWSFKWGAFALVVLVLIFPENDSPRWVWLAVLASVALLRVIQKGWIQTSLKIFKWGSLVVLVFISLPFMVDQIRMGLYPALEFPYGAYEAVAPAGAPRGVMFGAAKMAVPPPPPQAIPAPVQQDQLRQEAGKDMPTTEAPEETKTGAANTTVLRKMAKPEPRKKLGGYAQDEASLNLLEHQPGAKIQTGPGLPRWHWNVVNLVWNGPVNKDQTVHLCLLSPLCNLILAFLRVFLLAGLILAVLGFPGAFWPAWLKKPKAALAMFFLVLIPLLSASKNASADMPSKEILEELKTRLLEHPECFPDCASLSRMHVEANGNSLTIRVEASAQALTAIPLPGSTTEWSPTQVAMDGKNETGLTRSDDGVLWIALPPGAHQIVMQGPLSEKDSIQIGLPLQPYWVTTSLSGWTVHGIHDGGKVDDNLQLTRSVSRAGAGETATVSGELPPFMKVERTLTLGLNWEVKTTVSRVTPVGSPVVLQVPLLEGESVTSADVRVEEGKVQVSLAPNASDFEWSSTLSPRENLNLKAPMTNQWVEVWKLDASAIWHVEAQGIPAIHPENGDGGGEKEWRPWPGEELNLKIVRPEGVEGPTLTIESSQLNVKPGFRMSEMTLSLEIRSSLGGQHTLTLPPQAELQSVSLNGENQPIRQDKGQVILPITPGSQKVELKWLQPQGIRFFYKIPPIQLGAPSVNSQIQIDLGVDRWVLLVGGPRLGPAVLFWSLFIVLLLVAGALSRVPLTPLKAYEWVLLGVGLSQVPVWAAGIVAGWLLLLGWRRKNLPKNDLWFDFRQLLILGITCFAVGVLFSSIYQGLMGVPDMVVQGNNSSSSLLQWYQDIASGELPRPWVVSVSLWFYRLVMLSWALWIAWAFLKWLKWGWDCFSEGGRWRAIKVAKKS